MHAFIVLLKHKISLQQGKDDESTQCSYNRQVQCKICRPCIFYHNVHYLYINILYIFHPLMICLMLLNRYLLQDG